jgi:hypothetical protein
LQHEGSKENPNLGNQILSQENEKSWKSLKSPETRNFSNQNLKVFEYLERLEKATMLFKKCC